MLQYRSFEEIAGHPGLRIVLVKGVPSPWGQAAKTIFEVKKLDYVAAPWIGGEPNEAIVKWGGEASGPIVAWQKEKPIHRWIDILYLAERLAPTPSLLPKDATQRALMIGLSTKSAVRWASDGIGACNFSRPPSPPARRRKALRGWAASTASTKPM